MFFFNFGFADQSNLEPGVFLSGFADQTKLDLDVFFSFCFADQSNLDQGVFSFGFVISTIYTQVFFSFGFVSSHYSLRGIHSGHPSGFSLRSPLSYVTIFYV